MLRQAAITTAAKLNRRFPEKFLQCLYCHYVFDDQIKKFEAIIQRLQQIGQFIDSATCLQMLTGKKAVDKRYFHLSFDDGFKNNYTNIFPILQKYSIPGLFFVPTGLVGAKFEKTKHYCLEITNYRHPIEMLEWGDIKELASHGHDIGSHTKTHAKLVDIEHDPVKMEDEIRNSKFELENQLGQECKYISWPYGTLKDAGNKTLKTVKAAGYQACFGAYREKIRPKITSPYCIPRNHFEPQWPLSHIEFFAK